MRVLGVATRHWLSTRQIRLGLGLLVIALIAGLQGAAVPATYAATSPPTKHRTVPHALFGMQVRSIGDATPTNLRAGAIRLWDAKVSWRRVQPTRDTYVWDALDEAVSNAEAIGAREILYSMGVVPTWAASNLGPALYGPGTAAHPRDDADYLEFLTALATRYRGRITSYHLWNEANLTLFYSGSAGQLATLVERGSRTIRAVDPQAKVVAPSSVVREYGPADTRDDFFTKFAREMQARGWPVDAVSANVYVPSTRGPKTRARYLRALKRWYADFGWRGPIWDTETNYGDRRPGTVFKEYKGKKAARYVARTYIDSMRRGVKRVFWYGWEVDILGIDLTVDGRRTRAGDAFLTVSRWMSGAKWHGCKRSGKVTRCVLKRDSKRSVIKYASSRKVIRLPKGTRSWESLDGVVHRAKPGKRLVLRKAPILIRT